MSEILAIASLAVLFVAYALLQRRASTSEGSCSTAGDDGCRSCARQSDCTELEDARR